MAIPRREIMERFYELGKAGVPIIGGGAGTGISAKCEEAGGIDLIVLYNTGRYRMAGRVEEAFCFALLA
jgi:predicted TIM-barrel enzyme